MGEFLPDRCFLVYGLAVPGMPEGGRIVSAPLSSAPVQKEPVMAWTSSSVAIPAKPM